MEKLTERLQTPRAKRIIVITCGVLLGIWILYRCIMIGVEKARVVFNPARAMAADGVPVTVMRAQRATGEIRVPLDVHGNRAYVSGAHARDLAAGWPVAGGQIVSVSGGVDLDTGMHVVQTRNVPDGVQYAVFRGTGYFIPLYAISGDTVNVISDGTATARTVKISRQDSDMAYITSGLTDGDLVILTKVPAGQKVKVKE